MVNAAAHARYLATRYFGSLDGLRCLAILPVIWHHSTPRPLPGIAGKGPAGVDLFFCISGFLITTLLLREKAQRGGIALGAFYLRRSLRIWPLYYALLAAYAVFVYCMPASMPQRGHFFRTLPFYATFTANWFANFGVPHAIVFSFAWSLCIEEQFYAFWPGLVRFCSRRGALFAMCSLLALDWCLERGTFDSLLDPDGQTARILTSFAAPIGLGSVLALLLDDPRGFKLLAPLLGRTWSAPLALLTAISLLAFPAVPLLAFQTALTALVGACVIREHHLLAPALSARPVAYIGRVSYGLYLLNSTAIGVIRRLFPLHTESSTFVFFTALPLALTLAALSHRYIEAPFLRLRRTELS